MSLGISSVITAGLSQHPFGAPNRAAHIQSNPNQAQTGALHSNPGQTNPQASDNWQPLSNIPMQTEELQLADGRKIVNQIYKSKDGQTEVKIAPDLGASLLNLTVKGKSIINSPVKNLSQANNVSEIQGMPLISPPNRTRNKFYNGSKVIKLPNVKEQFEVTRGDMIHGRLFRNKWSLEGAEENNKGDLRLNYSFNSSQDPYLAQHFGDATYRLSYILRQGGELEVEIGVKNNGSTTYPLIGVGFHPYFDIDEDSQFKFSAKEVYKTNWRGLPTGKFTEPKNIGLKSGDWNPSHARKVEHVFTGLDFDTDDLTHSEIKTKQGTVKLSQSKEFSHLVIFNRERGKLCLEPQSCATDASFLSARKGLAKADARFLEPGAGFNGRMKISLEN